MKQPKRLTKAQKQLLAIYGLNPRNWMLIEETNLNLKIIRKQTLTERVLSKFGRNSK